MSSKPAVAAQNSNSSVNVVFAKFSLDIIHILLLGCLGFLGFFFLVNQHCLRKGFLRPCRLFKIDSASLHISQNDSV